MIRTLLDPVLFAQPCAAQLPQTLPKRKRLPEFGKRQGKHKVGFRQCRNPTLQIRSVCLKLARKLALGARQRHNRRHAVEHPEADDHADDRGV